MHFFTVFCDYFIGNGHFGWAAKEGRHAADFFFDKKNLVFSTFRSILKKQKTKKKSRFSIFFAFENFRFFFQTCGRGTPQIADVEATSGLRV